MSRATENAIDDIAKAFEGTIRQFDGYYSGISREGKVALKVGLEKLVSAIREEILEEVKHD